MYAALRERDPVRRMPHGSCLLTRYADLVQVYRDAQTFSSDKKVEFTPKYGPGSPGTAGGPHRQRRWISGQSPSLR